MTIQHSPANSSINAVHEILQRDGCLVLDAALDHDIVGSLRLVSTDDEYEKIRTEFYPRMVESLGKEEADHFVENWREMNVVCEKGGRLSGTLSRAKA